MKASRIRFYELLVMAGLALAAAPIYADADHDRARRALQAGEVMPLASILESVGRQHPGQVLEVELESRPRGLIYDMKILSPQGSVIKLKVDAKTGEVLRHRTRPKS